MGQFVRKVIKGKGEKPSEEEASALKMAGDLKKVSAEIGGRKVVIARRRLLESFPVLEISCSKKGETAITVDQNYKPLKEENGIIVV